MFKAIKEFLFGKPAEQTAVAPYKVETPAAAPTVVVDASLDNKPQVVAGFVENTVVGSVLKKSTAPRAKKPTAAKNPAPRKPKTTV